MHVYVCVFECVMSCVCILGADTLTHLTPPLSVHPCGLTQAGQREKTVNDISESLGHRKTLVFVRSVSKMTIIIQLYYID